MKYSNPHSRGSNAKGPCKGSMCNPHAKKRKGCCMKNPHSKGSKRC